MSFLKKLHPVFQFLIIGFLMALYSFIAVKFGVSVGAALLLLVIGVAVGASITTHVEHQLDYNLEDIEGDTIKAIESRLRRFELKEWNKIKALAAKARKDI
jgi:ABC-type transport system involved in cytochrome bd biosynthesis fused ATPase/permease subunit